jgi:hypothetical protein
MKKWPEFDDIGDLPIGIHQATITEVIKRFGMATLQRRIVARGWNGFTQKPKKAPCFSEGMNLALRVSAINCR